MFTFTASSGRPMVSAVTIPMTVRVPVPKSCDPSEADTEPSGWMTQLQLLGWPAPPQV